MAERAAILPELPGEAVYRRIVEQSVDAVTLHRFPDGAYITVNAEFERLTGYTEAEVRGRTPADLGIWESPAMLRRAAADLQSKGWIRNLDGNFVAHDGHIISASFSAFRIATETGEIVAAFIRDRGEQRRAEADLRASENRFRTLCSSSPVGISQTDAAGLCSYTNPVWQEMTGLSFEEALGEGWARVLHPDDREPILSGWRKASERGQPYEAEFRWLRPDGEVRWVDVRAAAVRGEGGELVGYVATTSDITARKRSQEERDRFFTLSHDLLLVAEFNGRLRRVNPAWQVLLGWPSEELVGRPVLELVHPDDQQVVREEWDKVRRGHSARSFEARMRTVHGDHISLLWHSIPVPEERVFYAAGRDISSIRAGEQMRERFVAMMSHDIRAPLAAALGFVDLLREEHRDAAERQEFLDRIGAGVQSAVTLAGNFLDVSQIQSGALVLRRSPASLNDIVRSVLRQQESRARARKISVVFDGDETLEPVSVDGPLLQRAIVNLVTNALRFSPDDDTIRVATRRKTGGAAVSVADRGPGVPQAQREAVFERFRRGSIERPDSTGLGLFIVKTVVDAHGGTIDLECPSGGGSIFTIHLPMVDR